MHGLGAGPQSPVSSYVGYSLDEPWGQPRVVFGVSAEEAERLASLLDGHDCVGPIHAEMASRPEWRRTASGTSVAPPWPFDDPLGIPAQASFPAPEALGPAGQADTSAPGRGDMTRDAEAGLPGRRAESAAAGEAGPPADAGPVPGADASGYGGVATDESAPADAVSRDAVSRDAVSRDAVPNDAVSDDAASDDELAGAVVNGSAAGSAAGEYPASSDGPLPAEPGAPRDRSATAPGGPGLITGDPVTSLPPTQANGAARTGSGARAVAVGPVPASRLAERDDTTVGPTSAPPRSPLSGRFPAAPLLPVPVRPSAKARRRGSRRSAREAGEQDPGAAGDGDAWQPHESGATAQFAVVASPGIVAFRPTPTAEQQLSSMPVLAQTDSRQPNRPEAGPEPAGPPRPAPGLAEAGPPAASSWPDRGHAAKDAVG